MVMTCSIKEKKGNCRRDTGDNVRIALHYEVAPAPQKLLLRTETANVSADNRRALTENKYILDDGLIFT